MKFIFKILFLFLAPLSCMLGGCNNSTCADNHSALPLMGFYNATTGASLPLDSINFGGIDAPGDSLLIHSGQRISQVYLPFRYGQSATSFFINYDYKLQGLNNPQFNDTITFRYTASPFFASNECGAMYKYQLQEVKYTRHLIDSIAITDSLITNIERERIQLFFRVSDPDDNPEDSSPTGNPQDNNATDNPQGSSATDNPQVSSAKPFPPRLCREVTPKITSATDNPQGSNAKLFPPRLCREITPKIPSATDNPQEGALQ